MKWSDTKYTVVFQIKYQEKQYISKIRKTLIRTVKFQHKENIKFSWEINYLYNDTGYWKYSDYISANQYNIILV